MSAPLPLPEVTLSPGSVALVGGGPGALDLITVRGLRLLQQADVVVVDRLGPVGLTALLGEDVEVIDVGKTPGHPSRSQEEISALLVEHARAGRRVVRLKGGDPFVLGRGGEEVLACRAAGLEVQTVPGVTSAIAGPAAGGVPVTHRGVAVALHVVNAHGDLGPADLAALQDPGTTTVLMMGVEWLPRLVAQATLNGVDPTTPVAIVQSATLPEQRVARGTLATIEERARAAGIGFPAVIAVGRTAAEDFLVPPSAPGPERGAGREALPREQTDPSPTTAGSGVPVLIGCAHGTRLREGRDVIRAILRRVAAQLPAVPVREAYVDVQTPELGALLSAHLGREVTVGFISAAAPSVGEAVAAVRGRAGAGARVAVANYLLAPGFFHLQLEAAGADVVAAPLGDHPLIAQIIVDRYQQMAGG